MHARACRGFTLIELLVSLAILALLASMTLPLAQVAVQRSKETELRVALREIRTAIDAYKRAADEGRIARDLKRTGYPQSLNELVEGVEDLHHPKKAKIYFLRGLPRDPMNVDPTAADADTWLQRAYASPPEDPKSGEDVYDVRSRSRGIGLNGVAYARW